MTLGQQKSSGLLILVIIVEEDIMHQCCTRQLHHRKIFLVYMYIPVFRSVLAYKVSIVFFLNFFQLIFASVL